MSLRQKQSQFARMVGLLIEYAYQQGYELTFGDAYRDPRVFGKVGVKKPGAYGRRKSLHKQRLAIDLNLFIDGEYMTTTEAHRPLGEYWESIGGSWGGHFDDANHYSLEHDGMR
jgi:hypothetical protein